MQLTKPGAPLFRGSRWLDIAVALRDQPRTITECAHVLGVHSGVIYRQLHEMVAAQVLLAEGPEGRGARFRLDPEHIETLEDELAASQPPGQLRRDLPVLFAEARSSLAVAQALIAQDIAAPVIWVAQLDDDRLILGINANVSTVLRARVRAALEAAGVRCSVGRVSEVFDGAEWQAYLAAVRDAAM
jgi:hypothetical protein